MSLDRLLQAAVKAGAREVKLVPGRRIVIVTAAGAEREVQGAEQSAASIEQYLAPVITADARAALKAGRAEWSLESAVGPVRAYAVASNGGVEARFAIGESGPAEPAPAPAAALPGPGS